MSTLDTHAQQAYTERNEWRAFVRILYRALRMIEVHLRKMIEGWERDDQR